ncbi:MULTISPECIES: hypothetical protein [Streptomyces]|uniref:Uncharacterized protein n=1 Tax=Streptomyces chartreusis NRRL 3882 TaxID=1079985 RepID=A0A2N9B2J7_STRCX|nr:MULTISPECIES: hypothetical protein [Streptomyces]MYS93095.1 glycosyltransferase [Streptomyces sp. SID5464]SOR77547.1 hypothetical protein SCNRRL3882_1019 [Streptomyces chartreusis NRRL 3882]
MNSRDRAAGPEKVQAEDDAAPSHTASRLLRDPTADGTARFFRPGRASLRPSGPGTWTALVVLPTAVTLWVLSLRDVPLDHMGDFGLLKVLPGLFWVALALVTIGFCVAAADRLTPRACSLAYVLVLITILHATPSLLYPELRYAWGWKHMAVIDAMMRHNGEVPEAAGFAVYNQWPGFFQFNALLLRATGLQSPDAYAQWAQPLANVLLLGPLLLIYRSITDDRRLIWGAVWIYYCCSWVGQDYFAPQAFAFLLFASVIALVLRQQAAAAEPPAPGKHRRSWPPERLLPVLILEAAITSSHQLTPMMLISALLLLSLPRRNRRVMLPPLIGAVTLTAAWNATVARPYMSENLSNLLSSLASPDANIWSGVNRLADASPAASQVMVSWIERGMSAGVFLLATVAFLVRRWTRRTPLPLLVIAPLLLVPANAYGGEMVFRAYMFALPAVALLIAALLLPPGQHLRLRTPVLGVVLMAMLGGLVFGYYSKEAMNYFSSQEAAATRYMTTRAPTGSLLISVTFAAPGLEMHYDRHERTQITEESLSTRRLLVKDPLAGLEPLLRRAGKHPAYILLSRAQRADIHLNGEMPADFMDRLESALSKAPDVKRVYDSRDAVVYRFAPPAEGSPQ